MKGSELLGTCPSIPTKADGIVLGEGLESIASVMDKGAIVRSLISDTKFGAIHLKAQYYANTGYLFPAGVKVPSLGAVVGRTLGRRHDDVPPYIYIGRDIDTSDEEKLFISEYIGPGFYGVRHAPFMIPDPAKGVATLNAIAGMQPERLDRRQAYLRAITGLAEPELRSRMIDNSAELYRQGGRGMYDEALILTKPWGFEPAEITVPVHIWQGGRDDTVPAAMATHLAESIPGARLSLFADEGHHLLYVYWPEILADLA